VPQAKRVGSAEGAWAAARGGRDAREPATRTHPCLTP
jgi:hypothetical protein